MGSNLQTYNEAKSPCRATRSTSLCFYMPDASHLFDLNDNADALGSPLPEDKARTDLQISFRAHKLPQLKGKTPEASVLTQTHARLPGRFAPGGTPASAGSETARTPLDATIAC